MGHEPGYLHRKYPNDYDEDDMPYEGPVTKQYMGDPLSAAANLEMARLRIKLREYIATLPQCMGTTDERIIITDFLDWVEGK